MVHATVQRNDGWKSRPWLRSVVRNVQGGLVRSGFVVDQDGRFGKGTEAALRNFQTQAAVDATGVADRETWNELEPAIIDALEQRQPDLTVQLPAFQGDLYWVHDQEGHSGQPYWPGGKSGVTLDPGVDLGHADPGLVRTAYQPLLSDEQYAAVEVVCGIKGSEARQALADNGALQSIRLTRDQAESILPFAARGYWDSVCNRFRVDRETSLPAIQTVLLSLAYNRGAGNSDLDVLAKPIGEERWTQVADLVGAMQQSHPLPGIPLRRQAEASLIRAEIEYLGI